MSSLMRTLDDVSGIRQDTQTCLEDLCNVIQLTGISQQGVKGLHID